MRRLFCALLWMAPISGWAQIETIQESIPSVFAGMPQQVRVIFKNPGVDAVETELSLRIYQASSATLVPIGAPKPWKKLKLLAHQTVIETVELSLPEVTSATKFVLYWLEAQRLAGKTSVHAYPQDVLKRLKSLAGDRGLGIYDPSNHLLPNLKRLQFDCKELEAAAGIATFEGKLLIAIFEESISGDFTAALIDRAKRGASVVAIGSIVSREPLHDMPIQCFQVGAGILVRASPTTVSNLNESASSQLNLLGLCTAALSPQQPFSEITNP